jgi:DNA-binding response OmpR family regulator
MRVLLVEDHPKLAMTVATGLRHAGMAVDVAFDGRDALAHVAGADYDVVVLDRDIPGVHGDDVCRPRRARSRTGSMD